MKVFVNGGARDLPDATALADVLADVLAERRGVAAAVNGTVVRTADWPTTTLCEDDRVEVVTAHQGG